MSADIALRVALVGNPNSGKTALFNQLTGARQKVANYAGVTVERKEGRVQTPSGKVVQILDLPGTYGFDASSPDEKITRDICLGEFAGEKAPDLLVCVIDATNLRLHLRFALELRQLNRPMVVALNMMDAAKRRGIVIDVAKLSAALGLTIVETVAVKRGGAAELLRHLDELDHTNLQPHTGELDPELGEHQQVRELMRLAVTMPLDSTHIDDVIDRWALHPVFGLVVLAGVLILIFQAVFAWAAPIQEWIEGVFTGLGLWVNTRMEDGLLRSLITDGVIAGLGGVLVFLPQILILFFFILCLEESGYLPRAAFLLDRMMFRAGLTGRSFIPLLSSYACAVPGIMATRSIQDPRDRLATILVAPLTTCSARLPVYTLLIGAFIPNQTVLSVFNLKGLVLFGLYLFGIVSVMAVAYVMKHFQRDQSEHALLMELPSYRMPHPRDVFLGLAERSKIFLKRVGGIIFFLTVLLWFLLNFPGAPPDATLPAINYSFAGRLGHALEWVFAPLGFNWQICIALVPGMAAREVAVSSLATVYALSGTGDAQAEQLATVIAAQWSLATALSLLVWFVFAPQCISTLAVIRRETNSWRTMFLATGYLFALAYGSALITYQLCSALGL